VFKVLIPDNLKPVATSPDAVNPQLSTGWLDYAQHAGFVTDPARVRLPRDEPRVEGAVQFVRNSFWAGERFADLAEAQSRGGRVVHRPAGMRIHGTLQARPWEVFTAREAGVLLPVPARYDVPIFARVKVHRDFHVEVARAVFRADAPARAVPGCPDRFAAGQALRKGYSALEVTDLDREDVVDRCVPEDMI